MGRDGFRAVPLLVIGGCEPAARDTALAGLLLELPGVVVVGYQHAWRGGRSEPRLQVRRRVSTVFGVRWDDDVTDDHDCACCCLRDDLVETVAVLVEQRPAGVLVVPPLGAPIGPVAAQLASAIDDGALSEARLGPVLAAFDRSGLPDLLFGDDLLDEHGVALSTADRRSAGEAAAEQLDYADRILLTGTSSPAATLTCAALLDRLAPGRPAGAWTSVPDDLLAAGHGGGGDRVDPLRLSTPPRDGDGVWSLDLDDPRPFHPDRLRDRLEVLGRGRFRARGHFWLPARPSTPGVWDGVGGQLSIGSLPSWRGLPPRTRLVVVGVDDGDRERVARAFADALVTPDELADHEPWPAEDGFAPWLGMPAARPA